MAAKRTKTAPKPAPRTVSNAHKAALATGRQEAHAVRVYLDALRANKPRRGRRRTAESITARIAKIDQQLAGASPIDELYLTQERTDLEAELAAHTAITNLDDLEAAFVEVAKSFSDRKGIGYATWRAVGVSAETLRRAGIAQQRS